MNPRTMTDADEIRRLNAMSRENLAELQDSTVNELGRLTMLLATAGVIDPALKYEKLSMPEQEPEVDEQTARAIAAPAVRSAMYVAQYEQGDAIAYQDRPIAA